MRPTNKLASRVVKNTNRGPTIAVQRYAVTKNDPSVAVVLADTTGVSSEAELASAVAMAFDGKMEVLPGSAFAANPEHSKTLFSFIGRYSPEARPVTTEGLKDMAALSESVFKDKDDDIWHKVGSGETAVIVRQTEDSFEDILASRRAASGIVTASANVVLSEDSAPGDVICWYDTVRRAVRYGVHCASLGNTVLALDPAEPGASVAAASAKVPQDLVMAVAPVTNILAVKARSAAKELASNLAANAGGVAPLNSDNMIARHLQFMQVLYGSTPYYAKLRSLLERAHGKAALRAA